MTILFKQLFLIVCFWSIAFPTSAQKPLPTIPLTIHAKQGDLAFKTEVARTSDEKREGLMFRTSLPEKHGMLFVAEPPSVVWMWMKNTPMPLDMLFIRDQKIIYLDRNAAPMTLQERGPGTPVDATLELAGGTADRYGIAVGDSVSYALP